MQVKVIRDFFLERSRWNMYYLLKDQGVDLPSTLKVGELRQVYTRLNSNNQVE